MYHPQYLSYSLRVLSKNIQKYALMYSTIYSMSSLRVYDKIEPRWEYVVSFLKRTLWVHYGHIFGYSLKELSMSSLGIVGGTFKKYSVGNFVGPFWIWSQLTHWQVWPPLPPVSPKILLIMVVTLKNNWHVWFDPWMIGMFSVWSVGIFNQGLPSIQLNVTLYHYWQLDDLCCTTAKILVSLSSPSHLRSKLIPTPRHSASFSLRTSISMHQIIEAQSKLLTLKFQTYSIAWRSRFLWKQVDQWLTTSKSP